MCQDARGIVQNCVLRLLLIFDRQNVAYVRVIYLSSGIRVTGNSAEMLWIYSSRRPYCGDQKRPPAIWREAEKGDLCKEPALQEMMSDFRLCKLIDRGIFPAISADILGDGKEARAVLYTAPYLMNGRDLRSSEA